MDKDSDAIRTVESKVGVGVLFFSHLLNALTNVVLRSLLSA